MFISFEGIDGSGKTTQIKRIANYIEAQLQQKTLITREPGGTETAEKIRDFALQTEMNSPLAEALLMNAARHLHVRDVIKPALAEGKWVLSDRFCHSTFAYQSEVGLEKMKQLHGIISESLYPDITFMIDVSPEQAMARRAKPNAETQDDIFEQRDLAFKQQLRTSFLSIIANDDKCHRIDGEQEMAQVTQAIIAIIDAKQGQH